MSLNLQGAYSANMALSSGGLATGTTTSTIQTTATISYVLNSVFYSKAATNNVALPAPSGAGTYTAGAIQAIPVGNKASFAVMLNAAGTFSFAQGPIVSNDQKAPLPALNEDVAVVGIFVVNATTATYTPGTTALGTGNTVTYFNVANMPAVPLI